jgi:hypothetical protein
MQMALDALNSLTKELLACRDELAERGARPETPHKQKLWDSAFNAYTGMAIPTYEAIRARLAGLSDDRAEVALIRQREWQGLTDEEYEAMAEHYVTNCYFDTLEYARAIEAKLKEKNHG